MRQELSASEFYAASSQVRDQLLELACGGSRNRSLRFCLGGVVAVPPVGSATALETLDRAWAGALAAVQPTTTVRHSWLLARLSPLSARYRAAPRTRACFGEGRTP